MDENRRVTVLHVLPEDSHRGAQTYAGRLRDCLAGHRAQNHLVASLFEAPTAALRADIVLGVRSGRSRQRGLDLSAARTLSRALRRHQVDIVVAHGGEALKYAVVAGRGTPVIYYKLGLSTAELSRRSRTLLYRFLVRGVVRGVAVSTPIRDQLHGLGMPTDRLRLIPNGRDPQTYRPGPHGTKAQPPLVLFVGQLEVGKRPDVFLDVVSRLRSDGLSFTAMIVGDGPLRSHLEGRATQLGVDMLGTRDDVPDLLRSATVLVLTSAPGTEGMPGVLVEAGLTGIPVVTTPAAGCRDIVVDGTTGFVVETDRIDHCAAAVRQVCDDPEAAARMGRKAREHCLVGFTVDHSAQLWTELVDELAAARARA
ncbi:glycosyltransferase family 4 protein [Knoellia sp. CPCC 206435]|uniref:glycosyltransferase family 4 protein n=1 Tax=Knoellia terrae TaxID=3404797 RepID=UPI003B42D2BA